MALPDRALAIKSRWLDLILAGTKTIDIRGSDHAFIGQAIYLLESKIGQVRGTARLGAARELTEAEREENREGLEAMAYLRPRAWPLTAVVALAMPWQMSATARQYCPTWVPRSRWEKFPATGAVAATTGRSDVVSSVLQPIRSRQARPPAPLEDASACDDAMGDVDVSTAYRPWDGDHIDRCLQRLGAATSAAGQTKQPMRLPELAELVAGFPAAALALKGLETLPQELPQMKKMPRREKAVQLMTTLHELAAAAAAYQAGFVRRCLGHGAQRCIFAGSLRGGQAKTTGRQTTCLLCTPAVLATECATDAGIKKLWDAIVKMQPLAQKRAIFERVPLAVRYRFFDILPPDQAEEAGDDAGDDVDGGAADEDEARKVDPEAPAEGPPPAYPASSAGGARGGSRRWGSGVLHAGHGAAAASQLSPGSAQGDALEEPAEKRQQTGAKLSTKIDLTSWSLHDLHEFEAEAQKAAADAGTSELQAATFRKLLDCIPLDVRKQYELPTESADYAVATQNAVETKRRVVAMVEDVQIAHLQRVAGLVAEPSALFHLEPQLETGGLALLLSRSETYLANRAAVLSAISAAEDAPEDEKMQKHKALQAFESQTLRKQVADYGTAVLWWKQAAAFATAHHRAEPNLEEAKAFLDVLGTELRAAVQISPREKYDMPIKPEEWRFDVQRMFNLSYRVYVAWVVAEQ
jgi:hypothetical protein